MRSRSIEKIDGTAYGTFATPLALPLAASGGNQALTITGAAVGEAALSLSADGRY